MPDDYSFLDREPVEVRSPSEDMAGKIRIRGCLRHGGRAPLLGRSSLC